MVFALLWYYCRQIAISSQLSLYQRTLTLSREELFFWFFKTKKEEKNRPNRNISVKAVATLYVEGLGSRYPIIKWNITYFITFYQTGWFSSICLLHEKIVFSNDQLIIQKTEIRLSITKLCRHQFEAEVFDQEPLL